MEKQKVKLKVTSVETNPLASTPGLKIKASGEFGCTPTTYVSLYLNETGYDGFGETGPKIGSTIEMTLEEKSHKDKPHKDKHHSQYFKDLNVGDKYYIGYPTGNVNLKITQVETGCKPYTGMVNNVDTVTGIVSGCGSDVIVFKVSPEIFGKET